MPKLAFTHEDGKNRLGKTSHRRKEQQGTGNSDQGITTAIKPTLPDYTPLLHFTASPQQKQDCTSTNFKHYKSQEGKALNLCQEAYQC
jgi:hypothetical protein